MCESVETTTQAIRKSLLGALHHQDYEGFRSIIRSFGLPRDSSFVDYELLTKAIKRDCKRIANLLLDIGARVYKKPGVVTPLHYAVTKASGWFRVIDRLLEKGARVADKNSHGNSAIHVAFVKRAPGHLIDKLFGKYLEDSSRNLMNKEKLSLLHIACTRPHVDIVAKLVGASENHEKLFRHEVSMRSETGFAGYTPLHFAVMYGNHRVANYLLECNFNLIYSVNLEQSSPLHLALEQRDVAMIDLILSHDKWKCNNTDKNGLSHLMAACVGSDANMVKEYLRIAKERDHTMESSSLVNSRVKTCHGDEGYTALHFAAEFGRADTIEELLVEGADCCATTYYGLTVHELAKENVKELLLNHCNVFRNCQDMHDMYYGDINGNYLVDDFHDIKTL